MSQTLTGYARPLSDRTVGGERGRALPLLPTATLTLLAALESSQCRVPLKAPSPQPLAPCGDITTRAVPCRLTCQHALIQRAAAALHKAVQGHLGPRPHQDGHPHPHLVCRHLLAAGSQHSGVGAHGQYSADGVPCLRRSVWNTSCWGVQSARYSTARSGAVGWAVRRCVQLLTSQPAHPPSHTHQPPQEQARLATP